MPAPEPVAIEVARAAFLRLMIPQLAAGGFEHLSASYAVELARLEGRTVEQVYCEFSECDREGHETDYGSKICLHCGVVVAE